MIKRLEYTISVERTPALRARLQDLLERYNLALRKHELYQSRESRKSVFRLQNEIIKETHPYFLCEIQPPPSSESSS